MSSSEQQGDAGTTGATDAIDVDALMQANIVRVFNERNADHRRAALAELYAEDATFYDPETVATGREAISRAVGPKAGVLAVPCPMWQGTRRLRASIVPVPFRSAGMLR